jgi:hypothetical protein
MGIYYNILSEIKINGTHMDEELFNKLCCALSKELKKWKYGDYDYYDTINATSNCAYFGGGNNGIDTLKCYDAIRGHISCFITWLHLLDIYVLKPHGCYIDSQPISYMIENVYGKNDHCIIIFNNDDTFTMEIIKCVDKDYVFVTEHDTLLFDDKIIYQNFKKIYGKICTKYEFSCRSFEDDEWPTIKYTVDNSDFYVFDVNDECGEDEEYILYKYNREFNWNKYFGKSITKYIDMIHKKINNIC